jgi:hypothetical protein
MIVESMILVLMLFLIGFGLITGYTLGKVGGRREGYRTGFDAGVSYARGAGRDARGSPAPSHLRSVK